MQRSNGKNESSIDEIVKKENESCASFTATHQTAKAWLSVHNNCLVRLERALKLSVEDVNRKRVLVDGNVLHQEALSLYEAFDNGFPKTSGHACITLITLYGYH